MSTLKIPIQINGMTGKTPSTLLERELFIDESGNLYYGNSTGAVNKIRAAFADSTNALTSSKSNLFSINASQNTFNVGLAKLQSDGSWLGNGQTLQNFLIDNSQVSSLNLLTLKDTMYGTKLPTNPRKGQVFFKI